MGYAYLVLLRASEDPAETEVSPADVSEFVEKYKARATPEEFQRFTDYVAKAVRGEDIQ